MPKDTGNNIGLYLVNGVAGDPGKPGAPLLHFSLLVTAATGAINGCAVQTQAVPPPHAKIVVDDVKGSLHHMGWGKYTLAVALTGTAVISFPPPAIGCYLAPFKAHFTLDEQWNGVGGWTLGTTHVVEVPVKAEN